MRPPGRCIFCGGGGLTKEHIWSEWTWPYFNAPKAENHSQGFYEVPLSDLSKPIRDEVIRRQGDVQNFRLRVVCKKCNNEWMSGVDSQAKGILAPMMAGNQTTLDAGKQRILATWFALKCMVLEFRDGIEFVSTPQSDRDFLLESQCPPIRGWDIWVGKAIGPLWNKFCYRVSGTFVSVPLYDKIDRSNSSVPKNTQTVSLGIGSVFFYGLQSTYGDFNVPPKFHERLIKIWPLGPPVDWPPKTSFTDQEGFLASTSMARFVGSLIKWEDENL